MYKNIQRFVDIWCKDHSISDIETIERLHMQASKIDYALHSQYIQKRNEIILTMLDKEKN